MVKTTGPMAGIGAALVALLLGGCASSIESDFQAEWRHAAGEKTDVIDTAPAEGVLLVSDKRFTLLGEGVGRPLLHRERESGLLDGMNVSLGGMQLGGDDDERWRYAFLPSADTILVFDATLNNTPVEAVNARTGKTRWQRSDLRWTLEQYGELGAEAAGAVGQSLGLGAGAAAGAASGEALRARYVRELVADVPGLDGFLFKTIDALKLIDAATGEARWSIDDVEGSGIVAVDYEPRTGDLLVVTHFTSLLEWGRGGDNLMRIDADSGRVRWSTPFEAGAADQVRGVRRAGDVVLMEYLGGVVEVYDRRSGELRFSSRGGLREFLAQDMGMPMWATVLSSAPLVHGGHIYVPFTAGERLVGSPDRGIRKFDLRTGEQVWESDVIERMQDVRDLTWRDGMVIGRVTHRGGGGIGPESSQVITAWDASSGEIVWQRRDVKASRPMGSEFHPARVAGGDVHRPINLVNDERGLVTAPADALLILDPASGEVAERAPLETKKRGRAMYLLETGRHWVVLQRHGITGLRKSDLGEAFGRHWPGRFRAFGYAGERAFVATRLGKNGRGLEVFSRDWRTHEGHVVKEYGLLAKKPPVGGTLGADLAVALGGDAVYALSPDLEVVRYALDRPREGG